MKLRLIVLFCCVVGLGVSAQSLLARPEVQMVCCNSQDDCDQGICCDTETLGMLPCSRDTTGQCLPDCVRPPGGATGND